jgi:cytochrome c-type biogenesis protein CcsB
LPRKGQIVNDVIKLLASLKVTVGLLVFLLVALAAGTVVESARGAEAAGRLVYYAAWFRVLLVLFGVNTLCAILLRWPPTRHRIGFLVTHAGMLVILAGALVTDRFKIEGSLALWEGEEGSAFVLRGDGEGGEGSEHVLPFAVRLDAFEIDVYPGTMRPAMFRSRVTVLDAEAGGPFPAVIEMNRELTHRGWSFFQTSYQQVGGREMSILTVAKDPGIWIVFAGYFLLVGGMCTVFGTRIVQRRAIARREAEAARPGQGKATPRKAGRPARARPERKAAAAVLAAALGLAGWAGAGAPARAQAGIGLHASGAPLPEPALAAALATLPVQHDGRVMPLDTLAREAVWKVTGSEGGFWGADAVALVLAWTFHPEQWAGVPVVRLGSEELAVAAGLPPAATHATFREVVGSEAIRALLVEAGEAEAASEPGKLPARLDDARELESRLLWLQSFLTRSALATEPVAGDPVARWGGLPASVGTVEALRSWYEARRAAPPEGWPAAPALEREVGYNRLQPSRLAWWLLVPATLVALLALRRPMRTLDVLAAVGLLAGVAVMTWGIAVRWQVAGRIPASNMYESLLFLGWGVGLFALVAAAVLKNRLVIFNAAAMAALTMALTDLLPLDPFIHPMAPVLSGTPWLAIHVPIIMVSYSVLALGVLIAHLQIGIEIFRPARREAAVKMNDLLYWYTHVGSILLLAGILTGSIWAASSWGRYWGWDPKEVWSLIAFLAYMAILHARFDRILGPFGVAAASIVAFQTILMTYIGVNYVLSAGLHSYGFGSGGVVQWMAGIALAEVAFITAGYFAHRRNVARLGPLVVATP